MPFFRFNGTVQDLAGNVVPNAQIEVRNAAGNRELVPLYADRNGTQARSNPFQADSRGRFFFHTRGGVRRIRAYMGDALNPTFETFWDFEAIGTAQEYDVEDLGVALTAGLIPVATVADLAGVVPVDEELNVGAIVLSDPDPTKNGYYTYDTLLGSWVWRRGLPDSFARLVAIGGTPDSITANVAPGVDPSSIGVFFFTVGTPNTANVTLSVNSAAYKPVLTPDGSQFAPGTFQGAILLYDNGDHYRTVNDPVASEAIASSVKDFRQRWLGALEEDPEVDPYGEPLMAGALYLNISNLDSPLLRVYEGGNWSDFPYTSSATPFSMSGDGTVGPYPLPATPVNQGSLLLFVDGIWQENFTIDGSSVTTDTPVSPSSILSGTILGITNIGVPGDSTVGASQIIDDPLGLTQVRNKLGIGDGDKGDVVLSSDTTLWEVKRSTESEAIAGVTTDNFMTPLTTAAAISARLPSGTPDEKGAVPLRKLYPTVVTNEALAYAFPSVQRWEDGGGTARMTKDFYQSRFDDMAAAGIEQYIEMYVEYRGSWFYEPSFAYPYDYDTARTGAFWHDRLTAPDSTNLERFDFIEAELDRCDSLGIGVWLGLSRQGDTPLIQDLYDLNVLGQPDPNRYGLSLSTRLSNAVVRTLQLADDLFTRYGHHSSFVGFKLGHESSHIPSANNYNTWVNVTGAGGYHPLNWYRDNHNIRSMIVPAKLLEGSINITSSTYAQTVVDSGADVFTWQNAAGPGLNYQLSDYTWLPRTTYSFTPTDNRQKYGGRIRRLIQRANGYSRVKDRRIENWSIGEVWRMGNRPNASLSISAGYNTPGTTGVTFTSTGSFSGATVGSTITTIAGKATITGIAGLPNSVVATINRAFEANSFAADTSDPKWAWSKGYMLPYAALPAEYQFEMPQELAGFERTAIYSWNFVANPSSALRPPLSFNDRTDYRARMENLFDAIDLWQSGALDRMSDWNPLVFIDRQIGSVTGLSGASISQDVLTYSPKLPGTFARVRLVVSFGKAPTPVQTGAAGNLTVSLVVNGVSLDSQTIYDNDGWMGGSVELLLPEWYLTTGSDQVFGVSITSTSPGVASTKAVIEIEEYMRP